MPKLFLTEQGTDAVTLLVDEAASGALVCSKLAPLEVRSAIRRKLQLGELTIARGLQALWQLQQEVPRWQVVPLSDAVLTQAADMVDRFVLRSLDAIQLGSAILAQAEGPLTFITYDSRLSQAAQASAFATLAPQDSERL